MRYFLVALALLCACSGPNAMHSASSAQSSPSQPADGNSGVGGIKSAAGTESSLDSTTGEAAAPNGPEVDGTVAKDGNAVPPTLINGTYLACVTQFLPTDKLPEGSIACRVDDITGNRFVPSSIGAATHFQIVSSADKAVDVTLTTLDFPERTYDVSVSFKGSASDLAKITKSMKESVIQASVTTLDTNLEISNFQSAFQDVERKDSSPKWVEITDVAGNSYLDTSTGISWSTDNQISYSQTKGVDFCSALTLGNSSNWALPSLSDLLIARSHGIGTRAAGLEGINLRSDEFWTTNASPQNQGQMLALQLLNGGAPSTGVIDGVRAEVKLSVICRRID